MSTRPIADCEACLDALTELVCDELDAETRASVLRHTKTCESCAQQLSQFRGVMRVADTMPSEEPSPRVRKAVLLAAREAQARKAVEAQSHPEPRDSLWLRFSAWLEQLGTWAMSPQVAMASVLLLMLGIGLVAFPIGREPEHAALRPAEDTEGPTQPAASAAVAPMRAEERAPAPETQQPTLAPRAQAVPSAKPEKAMLEDQGRLSYPKSGARRARVSLGDEPKGKASKDEAYGSGDDALGSLAANRPGRAQAAGSGRAFPSSLDKKASAPAPRPADSLARENFAKSPPPYASAEAERASESVRADLAEKEADASPEAALLAQGIRAAQAGDARGAIGVLRPLAEKGSPSVRQNASLWLARSYRATGDCTKALRYYAPLAASKNAAPALLSETADCYERTGDLKQASVLRSRAATLPTGEPSLRE